MRCETRSSLSFQLALPLLLLIPLAPCSAADRHQSADWPLPGLDQLAVPAISNAGLQVMRQLGYQVEETSPESGYIFGKRVVAQDPFGRMTELKVRIQQGVLNEKVVHMEATSCRGCVPAGRLDPQSLMSEFYLSLREYLATAQQMSGTLSHKVGEPKPGSDQWAVLLGKSLPPSLADAGPTSTPGTADTAVPRPPDLGQSVPAVAPLKINRVDLNPAVVAPGQPFTVEVSYTTASKSTVIFTMSIYEGSGKLFESQPGNFEAPDGKAGLISKKFLAVEKPGKYVIRVHLAFGTNNAEAEGQFTVKEKE